MVDLTCAELFGILFIRALLQGWEYLAFSSPSASQPCFLHFQANRGSCFCGLDREIMAFLERPLKDLNKTEHLSATFWLNSRPGLADKIPGLYENRSMVRGRPGRKCPVRRIQPLPAHSAAVRRCISTARRVSIVGLAIESSAQKKQRCLSKTKSSR